MVIIQKSVNMNDWQELYQKGEKYFKNAHSFAESDKFSVQLSVNMIGMAAEYLLGSVKAKYNISAQHGGISGNLRAINSELSMPVELNVNLKQIEKFSSFCGEGKVVKPTEESVGQMLSTLKSLNDWVKEVLD